MVSSDLGINFEEIYSKQSWIYFADFWGFILYNSIILLEGIFRELEWVSNINSLLVFTGRNASFSFQFITTEGFARHCVTQGVIRREVDSRYGWCYVLLDARSALGVTDVSKGLTVIPWQSAVCLASAGCQD